MTEPSTPDKAKDRFTQAASSFGRFAREKSTLVAAQTEVMFDSTKELASDTVDKLTADKPDPYMEAIAEYNAAFTQMNDKGLALLRQRERSSDLIGFVEVLINSIANTPKSFSTDFDEIQVHRADFVDAEEFARKDLEAARASATGAGAGVSAGVAIASVAPSAAMWVATTFGTASTGTAISSLSGAVASKAALAWLGGGAVSAGGGGTAAGTTLLALAGPIGWTVAGATLLTSIALFTKKKFENREARQEAILEIQRNTATVQRLDAQLGNLLDRTVGLRESLSISYSTALVMFGTDFTDLETSQQRQLAALVNNTKSCAAQLSRRVALDDANE
ncbi:hypothetical protein [Gordonia sp. (in: high G+C Gram-positive bacteria)]|uniref:hypothetical protein n=1 Tax=Gordonia sp. (in: high G+C Gram-positive bacteria) TaxID=84139 RepID=UPI003341C268